MRTLYKTTTAIMLALCMACSPENKGDTASVEPDSAPKSTPIVPANFVYEASIEDIQTALLSKKISCAEVMQAYLDRIEHYDAKSINAITLINKTALEQAKKVDESLAKGESQPSLFCVPVLIKDNIDTIGFETTGGSKALQNIPVSQNATLWQKLSDNGAIMIAKTNMAEWAFSPRQSVSSSYGRTANAYNLGHVPAGSSGGSASGAAANFATIAIGTDTGNSVRGPSSHLSLVGLRPTMGFVSRAGIIPLAFDRDMAGPMVKSTRDAARVMDVIQGRDPRDPYTQNHPTLGFIGALEGATLKGKKIGVLRALVKEDETDTEILALFSKAIRDLQSAGAIIEDIEIENFETLRNDERMFCPGFGHALNNYLIERGLTGDQLFTLQDLLDKEIYGDDPIVKGGLEYFAGFPKDTHPKDLETPCPDYQDHPQRQAYKRAVLKALDDQNFDAMIYPSWTSPPSLITRANEDYKGDNSQTVAPATGLPALTVPMGFLSNDLPSGLQWLGRPHSDADLLAMGHAYEQMTKHRKPPNGFAPLSP